MARKTKVIIVCDRHRGEVEAVGSIEVVVNGERKAVDLCADHLSEFRKVVRPWIGGGRTRASASTTARPASRRRTPSSETAKIREWAKKNGFELGERGRLPEAVRKAYAKAR